jgi:hypothetical protein
LSFWQNVLLLLMFVPLMLVWGFSLFDIVRRRDLGPVAATLKCVSVIILPLLGTAVFLVSRSRSRSSEARDVPQAVNAPLSQWIDTSTPAQLPGEPSSTATTSHKTVTVVRETRSRSSVR